MDTAELVSDDNTAAAQERFSATEAVPPPSHDDAERRQILFTAGLGVGALAAVGLAIIVGKKLWSSQAPKVQKVRYGGRANSHASLLACQALSYVARCARSVPRQVPRSARADQPSGV